MVFSLLVWVYDHRDPEPMLARAEQALRHAAKELGMTEPTISVVLSETDRGAIILTTSNSPRWLAIVVVDPEQINRWTPEKTLEVVIAHEIAHLLPICRNLYRYPAAEEVCADAASATIYGHDVVIDVLQAILDDPLTSPLSARSIIPRIEVLEKTRE